MFCPVRLSVSSSIYLWCKPRPISAPILGLCPKRVSQHISKGSDKDHNFNKNTSKNQPPYTLFPSDLLKSTWSQNRSKCAYFRFEASRQMKWPDICLLGLPSEELTKGWQPLNAAWEEDICLCFTSYSVLRPCLRKEHVGGSNSSEAASCYMAFVLTKPPHYCRAITCRKPAVNSGYGAGPSGWEAGRERYALAKFPFRHLSLVGFVAGSFVFLTPIFPGEARDRFWSLPLERQQGHLGVWIPSFATPKCWAGLG